MPTYNYTGRNSEGTLIKGSLRADSPEAVALYLSKQNIFPLTINVSTNQFNFSFKKLKEINIGSSKPKSAEIIAFSRNMAVMLDAGIPVIKAIRELAKSSQSPVFKKALFVIADTIQGGKSLEQTLKEHMDLFNPLYVSTISVGENTGNLVEAFSRLSQYLEMENENKKQLSSALRYPKFVVIAIIFAIGIINVMVIPAFKKLFSSFGGQLPLPTRILMATSNFMVNYWYLVIGLIIFLVVGIKLLLRIPKIRFMWDRAQLTFPIIGPLVKKIMLTRFIWSFALILKSGSPMLESLQLVATSTGNRFIQSKIEMIRKNVEGGESLSESVRDVDILSSIDMQMLASGEESGNLDGMLEKIAVEYDKQTAFELKRFADHIEPILLVFMGIMVGTLALAVFLPMWDMGKIAIKH